MRSTEPSTPPPPTATTSTAAAPGTEWCGRTKGITEAAAKGVGNHTDHSEACSLAAPSPRTGQSRFVTNDGGKPHIYAKREKFGGRRPRAALR